MKKTKPIFFALLTVAASALIFNACNKDKEETANAGTRNADGTFTITAKVENGSAYNSIVKRVLTLALDRTNSSYEIFASANYANGGFVMTLPATVGAQYLYDFEDAPEWLNISNRNAKTFDIDGFYAVTSTSGLSDYFDDIYYFKFTGNSLSYALYVYADGDVTVTGSETETDDEETYELVYNVSLKEGWNVIYVSEIYVRENHYKGEFTTTPVSGLKWYLNRDLEALFEELWGEAPAAAKKSSSKSGKGPKFLKHKLFAR